MFVFEKKFLVGMLSGVIIFVAGLGCYTSDTVNQLFEMLKPPTGKIAAITNVDLKDILIEHNESERQQND